MRKFSCISILLALAMSSCDNIAGKGKKLVKNTIEKVETKTEDLADKVVPHFDAYKPDTKYNKLRFRDFLKVEITPDVKNIYCHDDAVGIDADYHFAFNCNYSTAQKIIEKHQFELDSTNLDNAFGLQTEFDWWKTERIAKLPKYSWKGENEFYKYFWYDPKEKKAYYFDFDM